MSKPSGAQVFQLVSSIISAILGGLAGFFGAN